MGISKKGEYNYEFWTRRAIERDAVSKNARQGDAGRGEREGRGGMAVDSG